MLRRHRAQQASERLAVGEGYTDKGLVFADATGAPLRPDAVSKRFASRVRNAGVPAIRFHDLRHTHASRLLAAGVHPKIVQERLGHSSIAITLDIYSHVLVGLQADAARAVAELVDEAPAVFERPV